MKRNMLMILFLLMLSVVLVACGGSNDDADTDADATEDEVVQEEGGETVKSAEELYQKSCASCHGKELAGASGPDLRNLDLPEDEIADIAVNGHGTMPAGLLDDEEGKIVAKWLLE